MFSIMRLGGAWNDSMKIIFIRERGRKEELDVCQRFVRLDTDIGFIAHITQLALVAPYPLRIVPPSTRLPMN